MILKWILRKKYSEIWKQILFSSVWTSCDCNCRKANVCKHLKIIFEVPNFGAYQPSNAKLKTFLHIVTCRGLLVNYKTSFGLDDWIYWHIHSVRDYRQYSATADLYTFQFIVTHALGFSVFTSLILATDLSRSQYNFKPHTKSSFHSPIHLLPLLYSCQFRRLDSTRLDYCSRLFHVFCAHL
jgi:hypothetical protein